MHNFKRFTRTLLLISVSIAALLTGSCKKTPSSAENGGASQPVPANGIELIFTYGSEKEKWIADVTTSFNQAGMKTSSGKPIVVRAIPMGSGECIDEDPVRHTPNPHHQPGISGVCEDRECPVAHQDRQRSSCIH